MWVIAESPRAHGSGWSGRLSHRSHTHVVAGILGALAALWLVVMAIDGRSAPVLWALLSADVVVSSGIGVLAWKGLTAPHPLRRGGLGRV